MASVSSRPADAKPVPGAPAEPGARAARDGRGDRASRPLLLCSGVAVALVLLRSIVPLSFEQVFDSDQAIVGLMAKHLSEFRTFPLFFYGQNYMLGVQAWMAAPFFWVGGPTLAMLRTPLVVINGAVAVLLIRAVASRGVPPVLALVAVLPLAATTPVMSVELEAAIGASIEPFLYVLGLWALRTRPAGFGALACVGVLHREFTVFGLAAFAIAGWRQWRTWRPAGFAEAGAAIAGVWLVVAVLKQQVNIYGPGGGTRVTGSLLLQAETVLKRLSFEWKPYLGRLGDVLTTGFSDIFGAVPTPLSSLGISSTISQGSAAAAVVLASAAAVCLARLAWLAWRPEARPDRDARFFLYLGLVAIGTILAYGLGGGLPVGAPIVHAYVLFVLLLPIALFSWYFQRETSRAWRGAVALGVVLWAGSNVWDNVRLLREYVVSPPPSHHRVMADYLVSKGITHGRAIYWDAYRITFLARERVILTPDEVIRISAYKTDVDANAADAVWLRRQPCRRGTAVAAWCVVPPPRRPRPQ